MSKVVVFEDRVGFHIFVPFPGMKGHYLRTDKCVALVECPQCHSPVGVPCTGSYRNYTTSTHWMRRSAARDKFGSGYKSADLVPQGWETLDIPDDFPTLES
jgi:hypothetical protein